MSLSSSTVALTSWICASAIVAVLHLGQNYLASAFKLVSFCSFTSLAGTSQWSSKEYNSLICRTRRFVPTCIWTALTTSFFPLDNWVSYQSSNDLCSLIHLWSLQYHQYLLVLSLWLRLCLSRSATRYSCFHLFHVFSLHRCTYLCLFFHSSESLSVVEFTAFTFFSRIMLFDVNTFN